MTTALMAEILRELAALERAAAAIADRRDLAEAFTWRSVVTAIAERRARLLAEADRLLSDTPVAETPAQTVCTRVH